MNLPYTDKKCIMGRLDTNKSNTNCKLTVAVAARASVTDKTVTFAYRKNSDQIHQSIKLGPSHNRFTLVCRGGAEILPTQHQSTFCRSKDGVGAAKHCSGNYTDVVPAYEDTWWEETTDKTSYSLVIPSDGFPEEETKITVGCQKKTAESSNNARDEAVSDSPTVCSVDVTIEGVTSSAASSVCRVEMCSLVIGLGVMSTSVAFL